MAQLRSMNYAVSSDTHIYIILFMPLASYLGDFLFQGFSVWRFLEDFLFGKALSLLFEEANKNGSILPKGGNSTFLSLVRFCLFVWLSY